MANYNFSMKGVTETGTLTWNLDGTLQKLAISDPFSSANTQTCTNVYDDLARLTSNNCGSTWSNSFSYDVFGNIKKSGSSSFMPTYNSNNQYVALPSGTPSYNSNGNVTNDGLHMYNWDSEGKNVQLDTNLKMTYDAFGRWVERNNSTQGQITEAVYAPDGSVAAVMSGSTVISFYVHMPGGATAVYNTGGLNNYWHPDWLGTPRLYSSPTRTILADLAYGAYGELYQGPVEDGMFTGVAQVPEANDLRTFPARNLETVEGRWMSPDPAGFGAVDITNPQSFNRYAYVLGNPLGYTDPTGMGIGSIINRVLSGIAGFFGTPEEEDQYPDGGYISCSSCVFFVEKTERLSGGGGGAPTASKPAPAKNGTPKPVKVCLDPSCTMATYLPASRPSPVNWKKFTMYLSCLAGTPPELMAAASGLPQDSTDSVPETQGPTTYWGHTPGKQRNGGQQPLNPSSRPEFGEAAANAPSYLNNALACSAVVASMK